MKTRGGAERDGYLNRAEEAAVDGWSEAGGIGAAGIRQWLSVIQQRRAGQGCVAVGAQWATGSRLT